MHFAAFRFGQVTFIDGHIDAVPLPDASVDVVISNGVINLAADKQLVFGEAARCCGPVVGWLSPTSSPRSPCRNRL